VLERAGYEVIEAEDGEQALDRARTGAPDLILLDLQMPGLDGYGVLAALRGDTRFQTLPILCASPPAPCAGSEKILAAGFTDYLAKPAGPGDCAGDGCEAGCGSHQVTRERDGVSQSGPESTAVRTFFIL